MKKLYTLFTFILLTAVTFAQSPSSFNYQAVVRNADGNPVANSTIGFRISILKGSTTGTPVYTETQSVPSNAMGLVTLAIGEGTTSDDFSSIDWGADTYFMKVEADIQGGSSYVELGTSQLLSVPYALYSQTAGMAYNAQEAAKLYGHDGAFYQDASNVNAGTLNTDRFSAYQDLNDESKLNNDAGDDILTRSQSDDRYAKQVAFGVELKYGKTLTGSAWNTIIFDQVDFDLGGNYDNTKGIFTAPVDGIYQFSANIGVSQIAANERLFTRFLINGTEEHYFSGGVNTNSTSYATVVSGSITVRLNAGDTFQVDVYSTDTGYNIAPQYSHFSGHIVMPVIQAVK